MDTVTRKRDQPSTLRALDTVPMVAHAASISARRRTHRVTGIQNRPVPNVGEIVDPVGETVRRRFGVYGTGHSLPEFRGKHIGTVQDIGGRLVFHVFDLGEDHGAPLNEGGGT